MNLKLAGLCSVAMLACAAATPQASAGTLSWNFFTLNGGSAGDSYPGYDMGSPAAQWTQSTTVLSADAGVQCGANNWCQGSEDLYAKNGGSPSEQGLGLTSDLPDNEISNPYGIGLWLNNGHFTSVTIGSLQAGESWSVWGQTMEGSWTELAAGINNGSGGDVVTYNLPVLNNYTGVVVSDPYASN